MAETTEQTADQSQNGLLDFNWDDSSESFFGLDDQGDEIKSEEKTITPTEVVEDEKPKDEDKPKEDEKTVFFEEGEENEKPKREGTENPNFYTDVYKDLKESGIFKHVEIDEGEEIDVDRLYELQQEEIETEVEARLQSWATDDLDEDAQAFIKFKIQGGNTADFFKTYQNNSQITLGDIEDENYQDQLIRYQLQKEGWDKDEIEDRLEYLTDSNKKSKFAEKYYSKLEKEIEQEKQNLNKQAEEQRQKAKLQEEEFKNSIKETLDSNTEIKGLKISDKDKGTILNFLTKKDQKIDNNTSITGFQRKLSEVFKDPNKIVLLAKLVNDDFDFSQLEKSSVTKKTKEVKRNIENRQSMRPSGSGSSSGANSLASLFDK